MSVVVQTYLHVFRGCIADAFDHQVV